MRILIVDDTLVNRMILHSLLTSYGIDTDVAESGRECMELCEKNCYDLILMDYRMPEMNGVETFQKLKQMFEASGCKTPVICHTSEDTEEDRGFYRSVGFADILKKPVEPEILVEVLNSYLPRRIPDPKEAGHREQDRIREELSRLPEWLGAVEEIDLAAGVGFCKTADIFLEVLTVFADSIAEKSEEIEMDLAREDWQMYTLKVHSLKSMLRLIGAGRLADTAQALEAAGKCGDLDKILAGTPMLMKDYRALIPKLAPLLEEEVSDAELPEIPASMLEDAYLAISEFASCYDSDSLQMVLNSLKDYQLPQEDALRIHNVKRALAHLDWEGLRSALKA